MDNRVTAFNNTLIAPCGMNCGTCIGYLREKNKCSGCRIPPASHQKTRKLCKIKNCTNLKNTISKFCFDCEIFPCQRLRNLDKRYRTKYNTSLIENLRMIEEKGIEDFLVFETKRRTCPNCGSIKSVHRDICIICGNN